MSNKLENIMYAIGTQLYYKDKMLYKAFDYRLKHNYISFSYCTNETDKIKQLKEINKLKQKYNLVKLFNLAILESDYYRMYILRWIIEDYNKNLEFYNLGYDPIITLNDISDNWKIRNDYLKENNLDDWRKSEDKYLHKHYYWWINNLINKENYTLWLLECNGTRIFNTFHMENYSDNELSNILLKYILDNNIIPDQIDSDCEIDIINPFIKNDYYNGFKMKYSSNIGGFWYKVYLTAEELQKIYKNIGEEQAKELYVYNFFNYINSLVNNGKEDTKFYLYFEK